jgi:hypothetical protein
VVDVRVQLVDGKYHDVDSSRLAFDIAARAAFRAALLKGKSVLLEPIVKVEVGDAGRLCRLRHRRPQLALRTGSGYARQHQRHPQDLRLMNMLGYGNDLHSNERGGAQLSRCSWTITRKRFPTSPTMIRRFGRRSGWAPDPRAIGDGFPFHQGDSLHGTKGDG